MTHRPLAALAASPRQVRQIQARIRARLKQNSSQTLQVKDAAVTHNDVFEEFDVYTLKNLPVYIPVFPHTGQIMMRLSPTTGPQRCFLGI